MRVTAESPLQPIFVEDESPGITCSRAGSTFLEAKIHRRAGIVVQFENGCCNSDLIVALDRSQNVLAGIGCRNYVVAIRIRSNLSWNARVKYA
jgi:hypothetical protein